MNLPHTRAAAAAAASLALTASAAATPLLGVAFRDPSFVGNTTLYDINPNTGIASNPRELGVDVLIDIAFAPDGTLFATTDEFGNVNGSSAPGGLVTIDPATGATTLVGNTAPLPQGALASEGDLDFNPSNGQLFAATSNNGVSLLYTINTSNASTANIGTLQQDNSDISAIAFDANGELWALDTSFDFDPATRSSQLLRLDPTDASILETVPLDIALGATAGMDFDPATGQLIIADGDFAGTDNLYTADLTTGKLSLVGATGLGGQPNDFGGLAGLEFIPAPTSAALLAIAGCAATRRRR